MKGMQTIELSQASVEEAIQEYLQRHFKMPIKVTGVSLAGNGYGSSYTMEASFEQAEQLEQVFGLCTHVMECGSVCSLPHQHPGPHKSTATLLQEARSKYEIPAVPAPCSFVDCYGDRCELHDGHPDPHSCPSSFKAVKAP